MALTLAQPARLSLTSALPTSPDYRQWAQQTAIDSTSQFGRGWESAGLGEQANAILTDAYRAYASGDQQLGAALEQQGRDKQLQASQWAPTVKNFTDVDGVGSGADWALGAMGNMRSSMAPALGGIAGAGLGAAVGLAATPFTAGAVNPLTGATWGSRLGAGLMGGKMEYEEAIANAMTDPKIRQTRSWDDIGNAAMVKAGINGLLEGIVPVGVAGRALGITAKQAAKEGVEAAGEGVLKTLGKEMGKEGLTEGAQGVVGQATQQHLRREDMTDINWKDALNEAAAGAMGGGGMSIAGSAIQQAQHPIELAGKVKDAVTSPIETVTNAISGAGDLVGRTVARAQEFRQNRADNKEAEAAGVDPELYKAAKYADDEARSKLMEALGGGADPVAKARAGLSEDDIKNPPKEGLDATATRMNDAAVAHILKNQREYSEETIKAAAAYQADKSAEKHSKFQAALKAEQLKKTRADITGEVTPKNVKKSLMRTEAGDEADALTRLWQKKEGRKYGDLFDESDDNAHTMSMQLMEWVRSGYGAQHNDGEVMLPTRLIGELGDNAAKVVMSMRDMLSAQGMLDPEADKHTKDVHDQIKEMATSNGNDHGVVENLLKPLANENWNTAKTKVVVDFLREKKGVVDKDTRWELSKQFNNVDMLLKHFKNEDRYTNIKLGTGTANENAAALDNEAASQSEDSGSDVALPSQSSITENDEAYGSGTREFTPPTETITDHGSFDISDPDQLTRLQETKGRDGTEEMGLHDRMKLSFSGPELTRKESELIAEHGYPVPRNAHAKKAALKAINKQHRVLVSRKFEEAKDTIEPDQIENFRIKPTRYDRATDKEVPIDGKDRGILFIEQKDGTMFPASASQLVSRAGRSEKGAESNEVGVLEAEESFHRGLAQLLDAMARAGTIDKGARVGFKHTAGGNVTWLARGGSTFTGNKAGDLFGKSRSQSDRFALPKDFNYLGDQREGFTKKAADNERGHLSKAKAETDLTMRDVGEMTTTELREMGQKKLESLVGMLGAKAKEEGSIPKQISEYSKAAERAWANGDYKRFAALNKDLFRLVNAKHARTGNMSGALETLRGQLESIQKAIEDRVVVLAPDQLKNASTGHFFGSRKIAERAIKPGQVVGKMTVNGKRHYVLLNEVAPRGDKGREIAVANSNKIVKDTRSVTRDPDTGNKIGSKRIADSVAQRLKMRSNVETEVRKNNGQWEVLVTSNTVVEDKAHLSEGEEMSAAGILKEDNKPIKRMYAIKPTDVDDGSEITAAPTDADGYYDERKAAEVKRQYETDMRLAEVAEKLGDTKKAAELRGKYLKTEFNKAVADRNSKVIDLLRNGVAHTVKEMREMSEAELKDLAEGMRGEFWKDSVVLNAIMTDEQVALLQKNLKGDQKVVTPQMKLAAVKERAKVVLGKIENRLEQIAANDAAIDKALEASNATNRNDAGTTGANNANGRTAEEKAGVQSGNNAGSQPGSESGRREVSGADQGGVGREQGSSGQAGSTADRLVLRLRGLIKEAKNAREVVSTVFDELKSMLGDTKMTPLGFNTFTYDHTEQAAAEIRAEIDYIGRLHGWMLERKMLSQKQSDAISSMLYRADNLYKVWNGELVIGVKSEPVAQSMSQSKGKGSFENPHSLPMSYVIHNIDNIRPELRDKYRAGDGIAKLIANGDRTATTRTPPAGVKVGDHITFPRVPGVYRVIGFDKIDLKSQAGIEAWSKKEGWDTSMIDGFGKQVSHGATQMSFERVDTKQSQQNSQRAEPKSAEERAQAVKDAQAYILQTVGPKIELEFVEAFGDGSSGSWQQGTHQNIITLALNGDILGTAFHESIHEFFDILSKHGGEKVQELLKRVASNPMINRNIERLLKDHPEAQRQVRENPEEAVAFMYQFHALGLLKVGPETRTLFQAISDFLKKIAKSVAGLFSDDIRQQNRKDKAMRMEQEMAEQVLSKFFAGGAANVDTRQVFVDALVKQTEKVDTAVENIGKSFDALWGKAGKYAFSTEAIMDLTDNPHLINIARVFNQKAGEAMQKFTSKDGVTSTGSFFDAVRTETDTYINKMANVLDKYDPRDLEIAREFMSKRTDKGPQLPTDRVAKEIVEKLDEFFMEMGKYIAKSDVRRLDRDANGKPIWVKIDMRKNYWPRVFDVQNLMENGDKFIKDLLVKHGDKLQEMADEANKASGAKVPGTAVVVHQPQVEGQEQEQDTKQPKFVTPEDIAAEILSSVLKNGTDDVKEDMSDLGITPAASAVNRRQLTWLDMDTFDKYVAKDMVNIMSTYVRNIVKRGEYQKRFGFGGELINEASHSAILYEMGGDDLVNRAKQAFEQAKKDWKSEDGPYPTLFSVGADIHRAEAVAGPGLEAHKKALEEAQKKLAPAQKAIMALEGTLGREITPAQRALNSWVVTYQSVRTLATMLFTNFQDVMGIVVNGGTLGDAWGTFVAGLKGVKDSWSKNVPFDQRMERAKEWGAVEAGASMDIGQAYGSVFMSGTPKRIADKFFLLNGAEGWNRGIRAYAAGVAENTILDWVKNGVDMSKPHMRERVERLYGKGFDVANIKLDAEGRLDITDPANRAAVNRWILDAVPAPNAAHRPFWMSDPRFQAFAQLKNYTYTWHRTILLSAIKQAQHGNLKPAAAVALGYMPIAIAAGAIKEMLIPGDEPAWMKGGLGSYLSYGFSRAGFLGVPQMYANTLLDPASALGPMVDQLQNIATVPFGEFKVDPPMLDPLGWDDHTALGEGLGALPGGTLLRRFEKLAK